ncbi:MAG: imidazolonepropionase-like domain-containing protein [Gemmatimonadaceae bacterium]
MSSAPQRLVVNARIATGDPRRPWADALLMEGDRVISVGSSAELRKRAPTAEVVDARGAAWSIEGRPIDP